MVEFIEITLNQISELANLTSEIWHEYWPCILSDTQINYMVRKFQSQKALENQIKNEKYIYFYINYNNKKVGYFGLSKQEKYLFLSKLYLKKEARHLGIGTASFEYIKQYAMDNGYKKIQLTVNKYNTNAINAYNKWGFKIIDSVVTDIGSGFVMDDYIMEYEIIN